jgi:hypothetical protein
MLRGTAAGQKEAAMRRHLGKMNGTIAVLVMTIALSSVAIGPALAATGHGGGASMGAFSNLSYDPPVGNGARAAAFSDLSYDPTGSTRTVGARAFSDLHAFGPLPKATSPVASHGSTVLSSTDWSTDWRSIGLMTIAVLLGLSLALVSTLYVRGRRTVI